VARRAAGREKREGGEGTAVAVFARRFQRKTGTSESVSVCLTAAGVLCQVWYRGGVCSILLVSTVRRRRGDNDGAEGEEERSLDELSRSRHCPPTPHPPAPQNRALVPPTRHIKPILMPRAAKQLAGCSRRPVSMRFDADLRIQSRRRRRWALGAPAPSVEAGARAPRTRSVKEGSGLVAPSSLTHTESRNAAHTSPCAARLTDVAPLELHSTTHAHPPLLGAGVCRCIPRPALWRKPPPSSSSSCRST
jgi:hypothetical protein